MNLPSHVSIVVSSLVGLVALGAPDSGLAAPARSKKDLEVLLGVAFSEFDRVHGTCIAVQPGEAVPPANIEAGRAFYRMAEMVELFVAEYPYPRGAELDRSDHVHQAIQGYEGAYACNPGWEQRAYLARAMELADARLKDIREREGRAETAEDYVLLREDRARVEAQLGALEPPLPPRCAGGKRTPCPPTPPAPSGPTGYRGRFMDVFSLGLDLGGGGLVTNVGSSKDPDQDIRAFALGVSPGVRFLAGGRQRSVIGFGFTTTALIYESLSKVGREFTLAIGPRFEYGFRFHPKYFSAHAAFEMGVQAYQFNPWFGRAYVGGSGALCTWNEAICVQIRGMYALRETDAQFLDGWWTSVRFDIFRFADNIIRASDGE